MNIDSDTQLIGLMWYCYAKVRSCEQCKSLGEYLYTELKEGLTPVVDYENDTEYLLSTEANKTKLEESIDQVDGKIQLEDIKEVKQNKRNFSVDVPEPSDKIKKVGKNKYIKNDDGKIVFKRDSEE